MGREEGPGGRSILGSGDEERAFTYMAGADVLLRLDVVIHNLEEEPALLGDGRHDVFERFLVESCLQGQPRLHLVCDPDRARREELFEPFITREAFTAIMEYSVLPR